MLFLSQNSIDQSSCFCLAVLMLFMILNSHQLSPNFLVRCLLYSLYTCCCYWLAIMKHKSKKPIGEVIMGIMNAALASRRCLFGGDKPEDVCNLSATSSAGPGTCCSCQWLAWPHRIAAAHATINCFCNTRTVTRTKATTCTSWSWTRWSRYSFYSCYLFSSFTCIVKLVYSQTFHAKLGWTWMIIYPEYKSFLGLFLQIMILWEHWTTIMLLQLNQWPRKR